MMRIASQVTRWLKETTKNWLRNSGYQLRKHPGVAEASLDVFGLCVEHLMRVRGHSVYFIQVGANDGVQHDPLRRYILHYPWYGILVEPQPQVFMKLKANYAAVSSRLYFENVAVALGTSSCDLWTLEFEKLQGDSGHSIGSFDREITRRQAGGVKAPLKKIRVPCVTMNQLLEKYHLPRLDIVQVDVEGYDWKALQTLDLQKYQPALIQFESGHLSREDRKAAFETLDASGYDLLWLGADSIAFRREVYKAAGP